MSSDDPVMETGHSAWYNPNHSLWAPPSSLQADEHLPQINCNWSASLEEKDPLHFETLMSGTSEQWLPKMSPVVLSTFVEEALHDFVHKTPMT
jgi:hypothetical protein